MLETVEQGDGIWVCLGSHLITDYSEDKKLIVAKTLNMDKGLIKKFSSGWAWLRTACTDGTER